jgi:hypothetical protein
LGAKAQPDRYNAADHSTGPCPLKKHFAQDSFLKPGGQNWFQPLEKGKG